MPIKEQISEDLKDLVSFSVMLLGDSVRDVYGPRTFQAVEDLRQRMKKLRGRPARNVQQELDKVYSELSRTKNDELHRISKSYALMLELINACEAAYRSFRLGRKRIESSVTPHSLVFVFTSHPTEARSKNFLVLMDKIEELLLEALEDGHESVRDQLAHLLRISLKLRLANNRRPEVRDEAEQIFHTVMADGILEEQVRLRKAGINVFFRTWVGGDKDGHPKVGPTTMIESLTLSRKRLIDFILLRLGHFEVELELVGEEELGQRIRDLRGLLPRLRKVSEGDGRRVLEFKKALMGLRKSASKCELDGPELSSLEDLLWLYPAMVLPLELREDSSFIHEALKNPRMNIARMLSLVKRISRGMEPKWYVRGFIISMCQTSEDMIAATRLMNRMTGTLALPVVPLFENEKGLTNAIPILKGAFAKFDYLGRHKKNWGGRFEVMLGYSDSSKENGVLPGRLLVASALMELEKFLLGKGLTPVFFHGSGGSVSRGGGSIKEQIAWWPQSALNIYKVTVQGETVQRHFHHRLIMRSQVSKIVEEFAAKRKKSMAKPTGLPDFAAKIQERYRELVSDPDFQHMTSLATPYDFLSLLKIGSRPTKRSGKGKFTLRAIPWILCWTQTRILLPVWWGVGSAWSELTHAQKKEVRMAAGTSPLFQSYLKHLGFTLAKIELGVWKFQLSHSSLEEEQKHIWDKRVEEELAATMTFFKEIMGHQDFTWFNPRLGESIHFRSSMIHPLNVIQKISLERQDRALLRETVTGIASGMLTTG